MVRSTLSQLQKDFLNAFFRRESGFFLSGGAALAGFYIGHRETQDLDLFTLENEIEKGVELMNEVAQEIGASVEALQTSPDFRRFLLRRSDESVVIDLIRECVFQQSVKKSVIGGVAIDPAEEILANKLCALLSRSEIRDLVDVYELENAGFNLNIALEAASRKDTGFSPAQLAWILNSIVLPDHTRLPGNVAPDKLRHYLSDLIVRLQRLAAPVIPTD